MRICIFSDIHGNQYALHAFSSLLPSLGIDGYVFCGDIFGYYYGQDEVLAYLSDLQNLVWLLGNHDKNFIDMMCGAISENDLAYKYGNSYRLAASHINRESFANTLQSLNHKAEISICGIKIIIVHGTKEDSLNGRLYPKDANSLKELSDADVFIMGHTHFRLNKRIGNTLYLNPGSLGQPRDKQKHSFAVLTLPDCSVEFVDVNYDTTPLDIDVRRYDAGNEKLIELLHRSD